MCGSHPWFSAPSSSSTSAAMAMIPQLRSMQSSYTRHYPTYKLQHHNNHYASHIMSHNSAPSPSPSPLSSSTTGMVVGGKCLDVAKIQLQRSRRCDPSHVCYRSNRPVSWTDTLFSSHNIVVHEIVSVLTLADASDHLPIAAKIQFS